MEISNRRTSITLNGREVMATVCRTADEQSSFIPHDHTLVHVAKGKLELTLDGQPVMTVGEGECIFVRRDHRLKLRRIVNEGDNGFHLSIFLYFGRKFLFDTYRNIASKGLITDSKRGDAVLKMARSVAVASLFESFRPFYYSGEKPDSAWLESKIAEGLRVVLNAHPEAAASLFNFATPYRPDLLEFMEEYYKCDLTIEEMAAATGRSTATFKRDFAKVSECSPKQWVMQRRLREARELLLTTDAPIRTVMTDAGFKNFSHFSRLYHEHYGETPSVTRRSHTEG